MTRPATRILAPSALLAATAIVIWLAAFGHADYTLRAHLTSAGQLVEGGQVQVRGRVVGKIKDIDLAPNGDAVVTAEITDSHVTPLRADTRAAVRAVGQAGVANRFLDITPGVSEGILEDGAALPTTQTQSIVDLDAVLDTLAPPTRKDLQQLLAHSADAFAGSSAAGWNRLLRRLDPALEATGGLAADLDSDRAALSALLEDGATATGALASRGGDLQQTVAHLAVTFTTLARQRGALAAGLARAPRLLRTTGRALDEVAVTASAARPALRQIPATARPLNTVLTRLTPTLQRLTPTARELRTQTPGLRRALNRMPRFAPRAGRALTSMGTAMRTARPVIAGLRTYSVDFVLGIFNGLAGLATGNYNQLGQYVRIEFAQNPASFPLGSAATALTKLPPLGVFGTRYGLTRKCPGGGAPPAPDGSSPIIDTALCTPGHDMPASVNQP